MNLVVLIDNIAVIDAEMTKQQIDVILRYALEAARNQLYVQEQSQIIADNQDRLTSATEPIAHAEAALAQYMEYAK